MANKTCRFLIIIFLLIFSASALRSESKGVNWPSFRGEFAKGIAENFQTPMSWDIERSTNIKWKVSIPGLAHSSPVIWEDRIFLTTAVSESEDPELKIGLYGSVAPVEDESVHEWIVLCLDKNTGDILWQQIAHKGVPKVKRHPKGTHANSSPATDGNFVVAFFGSEGLYCYDMNGKLVWEKDFGLLDSAFFSMPEAQWGFASSPVIHKGVVVVQCDAMNTAFLAALDIKTGEELWRANREDVPTWSTPTIHDDGERIQIIVNGFKHIGGYDFTTGKEIWKISGGGDIPVPTPVVAGDLVYINSAHGRLSPIYAIRLSSQGDISLKGEATSNESIAWSVSRGGSYMQTPLVYGEYLYNLQWNGALSCYRALTGEIVYGNKQMGKMVPFSASIVAADGKLYLASEEGDVFVVKAGPEFEVLATNRMGDECMATPAISEGTLFIRTHHLLVAVSGQ